MNQYRVYTKCFYERGYCYSDVISDSFDGAFLLLNNNSANFKYATIELLDDKK